MIFNCITYTKLHFLYILICIGCMSSCKGRENVEKNIRSISANPVMIKESEMMPWMLPTNGIHAVALSRVAHHTLPRSGLLLHTDPLHGAYTV